MAPLKQKKLIFKNECNCIVDEDLLESAMIWWANGKILMQKRKIYLHGIYPAVSIFNEKLHVHRLVYCYNNIAKLLTSIHVHHKDADKLNCTISNLEAIKGSTHMSIHNKGKKLSQEHKDKIAEAGRRRKGIIMKKKYSMDDIAQHIEAGLSISAIARIYGCGWDAAKARVTEYKNINRSY